MNKYILTRLFLLMSHTLLFFIVGCEPSFCDCNDNYGSLSITQKEKCDKMIDRTSNSELKRKMKNCKNK
jgi:hypothetical protein